MHVHVQLTKVLCPLPENAHRDTKNESMNDAIHSDSVVYARIRPYTTTIRNGGGRWRKQHVRRRQ